jgi:steroid delta-isomerase-like uncharacterized protein
MKKLYVILPLALILCFMVGCQNKEATAEREAMKAQTAVEEQNKELMIRWVEEMDKGNFVVFDELLAEDYLCYYPGNPEPLNREAHKQAAQSFYAAIPDLKHKIDDVIVEGDRVTIRMSNKGTHKGNFMGIPPSDKNISFTAVFIGRFVEGKVAEAWGEADLLGLMMQLGMELKPKEEEK